MGLLDDVRTQSRQGRADAERVRARRRVSTNATMKMRLSVYWPAALVWALVALASWALARLSPWTAAAAGLGAGMLAALLISRLLQILSRPPKAPATQSDP
jgi:membrane associated rhomboid family serine protease